MATTRTSPAPQRQASTEARVRQVGRYRLNHHLLGKGNFARVELATHTILGLKVAVKLIDKARITEDYVRRNLGREARIMARLRHPHIAALYEAIESGRLVCLVTELAPGGDLCSYVKAQPGGRLSERTARPFVRQIVSALAYMHARCIIHRDLKMENVMLDETQTQTKIVDFGLSNFYGPGIILQTHCGSPEYAAPELFIPGRAYGPEVDVWSLGVIVFGALAGSLPFLSGRHEGTTAQERRHRLYRRIQQGLRSHHWQTLNTASPDCRDLLTSLLNPSPAQRAPLERVQQHPWLTLLGRYPLVEEVEPTLRDADGQTVLRRLSELLSLPASVLEAEIERDDHCEVAAMFYLMLSAQRQTLRRGQAIRQHISLCHLLPPSSAPPLAASAEVGEGSRQYGGTEPDYVEEEEEQAPPYTTWAGPELGGPLNSPIGSVVEEVAGGMALRDVGLVRTPGFPEEGEEPPMTPRNGSSKLHRTIPKPPPLTPRRVPITAEPIVGTRSDRRVVMRACAGFSAERGETASAPRSSGREPFTSLCLRRMCWRVESESDQLLSDGAVFSGKSLTEEEEEEQRRKWKAKKRLCGNPRTTCLCMMNYASRLGNWWASLGRGKWAWLSKGGRLRGLVVSGKDILETLAAGPCKVPSNGYHHISSNGLAKPETPKDCCVVWLHDKRLGEAGMWMVQGGKRTVTQSLDLEAAQKVLSCFLALAGSIGPKPGLDLVPKDGFRPREDNLTKDGLEPDDVQAITRPRFRFSSPDTITPFVSSAASRYQSVSQSGVNSEYSEDTLADPTVEGDDDSVVVVIGGNAMPGTQFEGSWRYRETVYLGNGCLWPPPPPMPADDNNFGRGTRTWSRTSQPSGSAQNLEEDWRQRERPAWCRTPPPTSRGRGRRHKHSFHEGRYHNGPWNRADAACYSHSRLAMSELGHPYQPYQLPTPTFLGYDASGQPTYGYLPHDGWRHLEDPYGHDWQDLRYPWPDYGWSSRGSGPYLGPPYPPPTPPPGHRSQNGGSWRDGRKGGLNQQ